MMVTKYACPKCGGSDFDIDREEVDIGVGLLTAIRGGCCATCGNLAVCSFCGAWTHQQQNDGTVVEFQKHVAGCVENEPDDYDEYLKSSVL